MQGTRIAAMNARLVRTASTAGIDLERLPTSDAAVFAAVSDGATADIPFLSAKASEWLREVAPRDLGDLAAAFALYRPAPVELGLASEYLHRRRSRQVPSLHPFVDDTLLETMGLAIYYDQLDRCLGLLANVTIDRAEPWRRKMMKGGAQGEHCRQRFISAARSGGAEPLHLEQVSLALLRFARIAYPRVQADGMAHFAYGMTYLRLYHPDVVKRLERWED